MGEHCFGKLQKYSLIVRLAALGGWLICWGLWDSRLIRLSQHATGSTGLWDYPSQPAIWGDVCKMAPKPARNYSYRESRSTLFTMSQ